VVHGAELKRMERMKGKDSEDNDNNTRIILDICAVILSILLSSASLPTD